MKTTTLFGKLNKAGFWYKETGFVIGPDNFEIEGLLQVFENAIPDYIADIKENGAIVYLDQLDQIKKHADKKNIFPKNMDIVWMMNIYILTKLGYITNDDHNGTQFMYFNGTDKIF
jgi:hypothetical protein